MLLYNITDDNFRARANYSGLLEYSKGHLQDLEWEYGADSTCIQLMLSLQLQLAAKRG